MSFILHFCVRPYFGLRMRAYYVQYGLVTFLLSGGEAYCAVTRT